MVLLTDFLRYTDEEISNLNVTRLDDIKVREIIQTNEEVSIVNEEETISGITEISQQTTGSEVGQQISFQPFNEAVYAVSGTSLPTAALTSLVNNNLAIHKENTNSVDATTDVDPTQIEVNGVINQENSQAGKLIATAASSLARASEKANGGIHISAGSNLNLIGRNVTTATEGVSTTIAPVRNIVSTVTQEQHNQHLQTANYIGRNANVAFDNFTDGKTEVSGSNFTAIRENGTTVAKNLTQKAVQQLENTATDIVSNAGDRNIIASRRIVAVEAQKEVGVQAGDVAITAASSNILDENTTAASAGSVVRKIATRSFGNLSLIANSENPLGGNLRTSANFIDNNSKTDVVTTATFGVYNGGAISHNEFNVITQVSDSLTYNFSEGPIITGNSQQSIYQFGGRTWIGKAFSTPQRNLTAYLKTPRSLIDLPAKTKLPGGVTKGQLDNCIPTKFKTQRQDDEEEVAENTSEADTNVTPKPSDVTRDNASALPTDEGSVVSVNKTPDDKISSTNINDALPQNQTRLRTGLGSFQGGITTLELSSLFLGPNAFAFTNVAPPLETILNSNSIDPFDPDRQDGDSLDANIEGVDTNLSLLTPDNSGSSLGELTLNAVNSLVTPSTIQDAANATNTTSQAAIEEVTRNIEDTRREVATLVGVVNGTFSTTNDDPEGLRNAASLNKSIPGVINIIRHLRDEVVVYLGIGGVISSINRAYGQVSETINVVTNEINDVIETVNDVVQPVSEIYNEVRGLPVVGNLGIWNTLDPIVSNTSATFNQLFRASRALTRNPNTTFSEVLSALIVQQVENRIDAALSSAGINLTVEQITRLKELIVQLSRLDVGDPNFVESLQVRTLISQIETIVGDGALAFTVYTGIESVIRLVRDGNLENLVSRQVITSLIGYIVGPAGMALIKDVANIYTTGRRLYEGILAAPSLLKLMNDYDMPPLARVSTLVNCLDLLNRMSGVIQAIANLVDRYDGRGSDSNKDKTIPGSGGDENLDNLIQVDTTNVVETPVNLENAYNQNQYTPNRLPRRFFTNEPIDSDPNELIEITTNNCRYIVNPTSENIWEQTLPTRQETLDYIADLPRLYQILNSVMELPSDSVAEIESNVFTPEEIASLKTVTIIPSDSETDNCFVAPRLNFLESLVTIKEISKASVLFEVPALSLLKYNGKDVRPTTGNLINIKVKNFINNKNSKTYSINKAREFYTPSVFTFQITEFRKQENIGLATLIPTVSILYLQDTEQVTYSYDVMDIGKRLTPIIIDAYLTI